MKWKETLRLLQQVQEGVEAFPGDESNVAHYARLRLTNALAEAQEILEAFAADEEKP